jgi:hypothetical protein
MANLELVALVCRTTNPPFGSSSTLLQFELVEDTVADDDGRPKRWIVVRPTGAQAGISPCPRRWRTPGCRDWAAVRGPRRPLPAGRRFDASYQRMVEVGVRFVSGPRVEAYGTLAVYLDLEGNRWDLLGPDPRARLG